MAELKLFGTWFSRFGQRIEIALKLKGVKYEFIEEDLNKKSLLLLKYNPVYKKIHVLLHNGKPICESLVILEYIDKTWEGPSIWPRDPYEKATTCFWAKFFDEKFGILQELAGLQVFTKEKFPNVGEWIDEFHNCSIIKENLPPEDKLAAHFQAHFRAVAASK
ncbi:unnamed protein product [Fraxinus pennsylvanica]|uniref:Glutathione S-transferase n=1 Tax=Fraxinus pennsylvanica TaxID=56036 RepID=A0AAD1Z1V1_9LAMI|nr:unnamed protein product [Fraxinus pennsylvanica]